MSRLQGKRALITGATSGIGFETARQFVSEGARVAITGNDPMALEAAAKGLGGQVVTIRADASDVTAQRSVAGAVKQAFGGLDVLFVNAGVVDFRPLEAWDEAGFDRSFALNVKGPFFLIQALLPILARPTSIILNTSINAHMGAPNTSIYSASKGALQTLIRTLTGELLGRGIRVNAVNPGPIATSLHSRLGMDDAAIAKLAATIPAGRRGDPSEVARAVVFFASDEAPFIVGTELTIDGGLSTL
jgi:NAD(P)-dependent dehydrogenase (short-subunit alcohol dehydrogenase family)